MSDAKMLQAIVDSIVLLRKENSERFNKLEVKVDKGFANVNSRLDMQGAQLSYLEDDVPTRKEFYKLEKRVKRLERSNTSN